MLALSTPTLPASLLAGPSPMQLDRIMKAGTFLGKRDTDLIDQLRSTEIRAVRLNHGGTTISLRIDFADGSRAAFKPTQVHPHSIPRKEIAAYRINRLLGLNAVPPATARTVHREEIMSHLPPDALAMARKIERDTKYDEEGFTRGELSVWIPVIVDSHLDSAHGKHEWHKWLHQGLHIPQAHASLMAQLSSMLLFDMLTDNADRFSGGNLQLSQDRETLFWMDNTFGFQVDPRGHWRCRIALMRSQRFSRSMVAAMRKLDLNTLRAAMGDDAVLTEPEMKALIARRDLALKYVDKLIAHFGEERVLVFQ